MERFDKIEGPKIHELLSDLFQDKVLIKVYVDGSDYEHLTLITDLETQSKDPLLRIDAPRGIHAVLETMQTGELAFEFTGRDQLIHRFEARMNKATRQDIWLNYPESIRRYQFRNNFRIKVPPRGVYLTVTHKDTDLRMAIDNISLGGAFCHCSTRHKSLIESAAALHNIALQFRFTAQEIEIIIERAERRRLEQVDLPKKFGVAYEFVKMSKDAKRMLTQQIYALQREILQKRVR